MKEKRKRMLSLLSKDRFSFSSPFAKADREAGWGVGLREGETGRRRAGCSKTQKQMKSSTFARKTRPCDGDTRYTHSTPNARGRSPSNERDAALGKSLHVRRIGSHCFTRLSTPRTSATFAHFIVAAPRHVLYFGQQALYFPLFVLAYPFFCLPGSPSRFHFNRLACMIYTLCDSF